MNKTFTPEEQIIRFIYDDLTSQEKADTMAMLIANDDLYEQYLTLSLTKDKLNTIAPLEPKEDVVDNVMSYINKTSLQTTKSL
ncbi:MAG: hypothetical protein RLZZ175_2837 [Bacteroidota bacterium]|jgi:hypothetical protein